MTWVTLMVRRTALFIGLAAAGMPVTGNAQTAFNACITALTGLVYVPREAGKCFHPSHMPIAWTDGAGALRSGNAAGGDLSGTFPDPSVSKLRGVPLSSTPPAAGQVLKFDGSVWAPATEAAGGGTGQSATSVVTTGFFALSPDETGVIPGLSQTFDVPDNSNVVISTYGTMSSGISSSVFGSVTMVVDGVMVPPGQQLHSTLTTAVVLTGSWSMQQAVTLSPGSHTLEIQGQSRADSRGSATFANAASTVIILKR